MHDAANSLNPKLWNRKFLVSKPSITQLYGLKISEKAIKNTRLFCKISARGDKINEIVRATRMPNDKLLFKTSISIFFAPITEINR